MKEIIALSSVLLMGCLPCVGQSVNWWNNDLIENQETVGSLFGEQRTKFAILKKEINKRNSNIHCWKINTGNLPDLTRCSFHTKANKSRCSTKLKLKGEQLKAGEQIIGKSLHGVMVIVIQF